MSRIVCVQEMPWPLVGNQRLAWYSPARRAFIIGNHADKHLLPARPGAATSPLVQRADAYAMRTTAYDDQLPAPVADELALVGLDGFEFLTRGQYDRAYPGKKWGSTGPIDQALTSGLNSELAVLHPGSGAVVSVRDRRLNLYALAESGLTPLGELKTRAPLTAVWAAPPQQVLYYGTNASDLVTVPVTPKQLGPQKKLTAFERNVNAIRSSKGGEHLFAGGMGYLAKLTVTGSSCTTLAKSSVPCRSLEVLSDHWLLVNGGLHGLSLYDISGDGLRADATHKPASAVDRVICSTDGRWVLAVYAPPAGMGLYEVSMQ